MPPSRRRPPASQPPSRRPRVAGLRKPEAPETAPEADETPTQIIPAATLPTPAPRNTDGSTTTAGAEESMAARRARRAAKPEQVDEAPEEEEAEETTADSGRGVPGWVGAIGSGARGMADSTKILVLAIAAVLLACAGAYFGLMWHNNVDNATTSNSAYVDTGTTAKVVSDVVNAMQRVLTYTYANPNQTAQDAQNLLTGSAQCQFNELYKTVRAQAPAQKITVTASIDTKNSGVEMIQGDQARLLLMIYQESTRGSDSQQATSEGVLEVGAIKQGDTWKVDNISTFGAGQNPANCK